jgi:uncharacterized protein YndB with AHSA1/START domain
MKPSLTTTVASVVLPLAVTSSARAAERVLRTTVKIDRPIAEVFAAWTTDAGLEAWLAKDARVDLRVGGALELNAIGEVGGEGTTTLKILAIEPGRMLSYEWTAPAQFPEVNATPGKWAVVRFAEDGAGTTVTATALGWREGAEWDAAYTYFENGNRVILDLMKTRLEESAGSWYTPAPPVGPGDVISEIDVAAPQDVVWDTLTNSEKMTRWMSPLVEVDWRVGGTIKTNYNKDAGIGGKGTITHTILTYEPGVMYAARYDAPDAPPAAVLGQQLVHITTLEPIDATHTRIRVTGTGYGEGPDWAKTRAFFAAGNPYELTVIKKLLEPGAAEPDGSAMDGHLE